MTNKIKYLSFNINEQEKIRFGRKILPIENINFFYYESMVSWFKNLRYQNVDICFLFGSRPPDSFAAKYALKISKKIIILQHAKNSRRKKFTMNYFLQNYKKLFFWLNAIFFLKFVTYFKRNNNSYSDIVVFYFTEEYKKDWEERLGKYSPKFVKCDPPDVSIYGTEQDIQINEKKIDCFYIDEPLTTTLGISSKEEEKLLLDLQDLVTNKTIYIKLHPRSYHGKFKNFTNVIIVNEIYENCTFLVGYKSGLLDYNFKFEHEIKLIDYQWKQVFNNKINSKSSYIDDVMKELQYDL